MTSLLSMMADSKPNSGIIQCYMWICQWVSLYLLCYWCWCGVKNARGLTMDGLLQKFKNNATRLALELEDLGFFKNCQELGDNSQKRLTNILSKHLDNSEWPTVLFELTQILHILTKWEVIVLIDEYDMPILHAVECNYFPIVHPILNQLWCSFSPHLYRQMNSFMKYSQLCSRSASFIPVWPNRSWAHISE